MTLTQLACHNVLRNRRTYAAYFLSSAFSVMVFFVCALFIYHPAIRAGVMFDGARQALIAAEAVMYLFAMLFVLYSVSSFLRSRTREFGILMLHGMTHRQLHRMVFLENMMIGLGAIFTGIIGGLLTGKLFLLLGARFLLVAELAFFINWQVLALTISSFILLFLLISACTSLLLKRGKLIELFQAGQLSKTAPAVSRLQAVAAWMLIGTSYALAATADAASIYIRVVPVTTMTILGTYLFYTQAGIALIGVLKRYKTLYWRRTNLVAISGLAHRLREHARMFFMVTIIWAVAFCSVGFFASVTTFTEDLKADYPAAVAYVAKPGHTESSEQLALIESELTARGIAARQWTMPIQYVRAGDADELPLIAYSDYAMTLQMSGIAPAVPPLGGTEALVMLGSLRDRTILELRELQTYTLTDSDVELREIGYTIEVIVPDHLVSNTAEPSSGEFSGLIVADELFSKLRDDSLRDIYTGYYIDELRHTSGIAAGLAEQGILKYHEDSPYAIAVSGTIFDVRSSLYSTMLFIALLVGIVFFIAAGSFLYFRLYAELDYDRRQYQTLVRIGLTVRELRRIVTRQVAWLFFVPFGLAVLHSLFAFMALQQLFHLSIATRLVGVIAGFAACQVLYFFFIRNRYWRHIRKSWH